MGYDRDDYSGRNRRFDYDSRPALTDGRDTGHRHTGTYEIYMDADAATRGRTKQRVPRSQQRERWAAPDTSYSSSLSAIPKYLSGALTVEQQEALAVRVRIEEITKKLNLNELDLDYHLERSPSPEPLYDDKGKRLNTRDQRARDKLNLERQYLVELAMTMNPNFKPPADYTPVSTKKMRKLYIPIEKFPDYNFIGLIIGPRGNTQKRMEKETGCKIAIRGKGSVKEGRGRKEKNPGEDDKLHVLITADNEVQLQKATQIIQQLLMPVDEGMNEHKRQQLRELAEINGTLRDRMFMQPEGQTWERVQIKCAICGESSHPTSDCTFKSGNVPLPAAQQKNMEDEYDKFLNEVTELSEKPADNAVYNEFMASISTETAPPWAQQPQGYPQTMVGAPAAPWQALPPAQASGAAPWAQPAAQAAPWQQQQPQVPPQGYANAPWQQPQS